MHVAILGIFQRSGKLAKWFPSLRKQRIVIQIPPVSHLAADSGKNIEKLFIDRIILKQRVIFYWRNEQFGFTTGKSTEDALRNVLGEIRVNKS